MARSTLHGRILALILAGLPLAAGGAMAQQTHPAAGPSPMMSEMQSAMQTMDRNMMTGMQAGSPDQMYAAMMIPHHQGAVDMSRLALHDIKDAELHRIAEKTISENEKSIHELRAWQQKHH